MMRGEYLWYVFNILYYMTDDERRVSVVCNESICGMNSIYYIIYYIIYYMTDDERRVSVVCIHYYYMRRVSVVCIPYIERSILY
jgi:hypothetical protein